MNQIESSTVPIYRAVVFAIVWNVLTVPGIYLFGRGIWRGGVPAALALMKDWPIYIWLIFPIIAVVSAIRAVRLSAGALRYGRSRLTVHTPAPVVGGSLNAMIRIPRLEVHEHQRVRLTLRCELTELRTAVPDRGSRNRKITLMTGWKNRIVLPSAAVSRSGDDSLLPVKFEIPATCQPTGPLPVTVRGRSSRATWWLDARAEPRSLWSASFEVPVAPQVERHQIEETRATTP